MDYDWKVHDDLCGSDHFPVLLNNIGPDPDEPVSRWKLNKANWAQFQTLSTTRLLEDTVRKADDPIESFASILINIAEETVPKTATKSKKAKKPWFTEDCKTAIKQRKGALRQFNNRPTHDNLNNYRIFRAKARRTIKESKKKSWKQYVSQLNSRTSGGGWVVRWSWVNFQCRGVLLVWIRVGQGPTALAVGAGGGCLDIFTLIYPFSSLSPSLGDDAI